MNSTEVEAELHACEAEEVVYSRTLQGCAVIVICAASLLGAIIPIFMNKCKVMNHDSFVFILLRAFGVGLIVSTAIIHMLFPAHEIFNDEDPCGGIPMEWRVCPNWAGIFAIIGAYFVQFIQTMVLDHFKRKDAKVWHDHHHGLDNYHDRAAEEHRQVCTDLACEQPECNDMVEDMVSQTFKPDYRAVKAANDEDDNTREATAAPALGKVVPQAGSFQGSAISESTSINNSSANLTKPLRPGSGDGHHTHDGCVAHVMIQNQSNDRTKRVTTYLLEAGIMFHSIIIGLALGVAPSEELPVLLIAVTFHQLFEGIAMSSAALDSGMKSMKFPLLMAIVYSLSTPLGQLIGIGMTYSTGGTSSQGLNLAVGIFDALSAGILVYDALVNILTPLVTHSDRFTSLPSYQKPMVFFMLWVGSTIMAVIGQWA